MALVDVTVYYLQMFAHPLCSAPAPMNGLSVMHAKCPTVAYYRFLYNAVGKDYHWLFRGSLSDADLAVLIHNPLDELHVLHKDGTPVGFAELDRRHDGEIELVQFGLMPGFIGQGLGKVFLQWIIDKAWSYEPKRLWLHTCTLDHPRALPNYLRAGFVLYKQEEIRREIGADI